MISWLHNLNLRMRGGQLPHQSVGREQLPPARDSLLELELAIEEHLLERERHAKAKAAKLSAAQASPSKQTATGADSQELARAFGRLARDSQASMPSSQRPVWSVARDGVAARALIHLGQEIRSAAHAKWATLPPGYFAGLQGLARDFACDSEVLVLMTPTRVHAALVNVLPGWRTRMRLATEAAREELCRGDATLWRVQVDGVGRLNTSVVPTSDFMALRQRGSGLSELEALAGRAAYRLEGDGEIYREEVAIARIDVRLNSRGNRYEADVHMASRDGRGAARLDCVAALLWARDVAIQAAENVWVAPALELIDGLPVAVMLPDLVSPHWASGLSNRTEARRDYLSDAIQRTRSQGRQAHIPQMQTQTQDHVQAQVHARALSRVTAAASLSPTLGGAASLTSGAAPSAHVLAGA